MSSAPHASGILPSRPCDGPARPEAAGTNPIGLGGRRDGGVRGPAGASPAPQTGSEKAPHINARERAGAGAGIWDAGEAMRSGSLQMANDAANDAGAETAADERPCSAAHAREPRFRSRRMLGDAEEAAEAATRVADRDRRVRVPCRRTGRPPSTAGASSGAPA